ncbi:hypothetical protein GCM10007924_17840 [Sneathiella chinensis]|uniref:Pilus assembly protein CpaD n=2 Tax=Sneathiella chinensis TaxID=349750 RepID=A0ABQ5U403_9PROT|nr:hypothetical protein GCM10007924_17840 [Sneathiella chinensis]
MVISNTRLKQAGMGLLLALTAAACAPIDPETGTFVQTASPENATLQKQISVEKVTPILKVSFDRGRADLSDLEKGRILDFAVAQKARYRDVFLLELPPFNDAAGLNEKRFGSIGGFLENQGFRVEPKIVNEAVGDGLRIYREQYVATVSDESCNKGWTRPAGLNYENLPLPHVGCSTASGLVQMISNPKDLVDPAPMGGYDGERAAAAIKAYRSTGADSGS